MPRKNSRVSCCVTGCYTTSDTDKELSFFAIPKHKKRRDKWLRLIGREDLNDNERYLNTRRVCENHFGPGSLIYLNNRCILKKLSLPSRRLPGIADVLITSKLTQTNSEDGNYSKNKSTITSDIEENEDEQNKLYMLCDKYLTKEMAQLIKMSQNLKYTSKRNNEDYLHFCLNLYQTSPQAYQIFNNILFLPPISTLLKKIVHMDTKLNHNVLSMMKIRVAKMTAEEKNCSVIIGFTRTKPNLCYNIKKDKIFGLQEINGLQFSESALKALVVMIRGLFSDWKLPFAYAMLPKNGKKADIINWIDRILQTLIDIGLNVRTLIHNIKDDWINLRNESVSHEMPFFTMHGKKIYYIYDPADLIMSVRDSFLLNDFRFQEYVAKYEYIVKFYQEDVKRTIPIASKLTNSHISPNKFEKKEVAYATQLLSKTVANGLWTYINFNLIEEKGRGTVEFITRLNNLFDILNISKQKPYGNKYKKTSTDETQISFMEGMIDFFKTLKVFNSINEEDVTSTTKFIQGFLITIRSILLLINDLKKEGYNVLLTKNLHREALDTFLKQMYNVDGLKKLTCLKFESAYKKVFLIYHRKFYLRGNIEGEIEMFADKSCILKEKSEQGASTEAKREVPTTSKLPTSATIEENVKILAEDYKQINTPEKYSLFYVCGYLLKKAEENHSNCLNLLRYIWAYERNIKPSLHCTHLRYEEYKKGNPDRILPAVPCDDFVNFVQKMDKDFHDAIETYSIRFPTAKYMYEGFDKRFAAPCICFPTTYVMKLFIRIKIFYSIMNHNRNMRTVKLGSSYPFVIDKLL